MILPIAILILPALVLVFAIRWYIIAKEDKRIEEWLAKSHQYKQENPISGYSHEFDGYHDHEIFLLGFIRAPSAWGRIAGHGGESEWARRREVMAYSRLIRAASRIAWREKASRGNLQRSVWGIEPWWQRLITALALAYFVSVLAYLVLFGVSFAIQFVFQVVAPQYLIAFAIIVLTGHWFRDWTLKADR